MALFKHWQNTANNQIKKQPIIFLVIEVIIIIIAVLIMAVHSCSNYKILLQKSENNIMTANPIDESHES